MSDRQTDTTDRYATLRAVLNQAAEQASHGKGSERHDPNAERFEDQQIVQIGEWLGSSHFEIGQAVKKALESTGLPYERARAELLGAINYLAAAVIVNDLKIARFRDSPLTGETDYPDGGPTSASRKSGSQSSA